MQIQPEEQRIANSSGRERGTSALPRPSLVEGETALGAVYLACIAVKGWRGGAVQFRGWGGGFGGRGWQPSCTGLPTEHIW